MFYEWPEIQSSSPSGEKINSPCTNSARISPRKIPPEKEVYAGNLPAFTKLKSL